MLTQEVGKEISEFQWIWVVVLFFNSKTSVLSSNFDLMLCLQEEAWATFSLGCRIWTLIVYRRDWLFKNTWPNSSLTFMANLTFKWSNLAPGFFCTPFPPDGRVYVFQLKIHSLLRAFVFLSVPRLIYDLPFMIFIKSWNHLGWKGPLRSFSPTIPPALQSPPLNCDPKTTPTCLLYPFRNLVLILCSSNEIAIKSEVHSKWRLTFWDYFLTISHAVQ